MARLTAMSANPSLVRGARLDTYEVVSFIGAGTMGEVYLARDTRLGREVALKILPPEVTAHPDRRARFEREARILASVHHPHIATLFGIAESGGITGLVLEHVDGITLAERLRSGPMPLEDVTRLARHLIDALDAAHELGIVHRDLKPANLKITPGGALKVLDFGIAIERTAEAGDGTTVLSARTQEGTIVGTAAYMSPEQARGLRVDKRADIWAFGCVLFEMCSGRRPFGGDGSISGAIAAVLEREPDWSALPPSVPDDLKRLLRQCLQKDPKARLRDIADAADYLDARHSESAAQSPRRSIAALIAWTTAGLLAVALAAVVPMLMRPPPPEAEPVRFGVHVPGRLTPPFFLALSPDGRRLAFVATGVTGTPGVWLRELNLLDARPLAGTDDAAHVFWSPDSGSIGFFAQGKLQRIDVGTGAVKTIASPALRGGGTWAPDGTILFVSAPGVVSKVSASGGVVSPVDLKDERGTSLRGSVFPRFLPDGRHFLLFAGSAERRGVYVASLEASTATFLARTEYKAMYASGYLLFMRDDLALMAQPFDLERLQLTGDAALVTQNVIGMRGAAHNAFSASANGTLAVIETSQLHLHLEWIDRAGRLVRTLGDPMLMQPAPRLARDGRIATTVGPFGAEDIWVYDAGGHGTRLTFDRASDNSPMWSADGQRLVFQSARNAGRGGFYETSAKGGTETRLFECASMCELLDWSADGRFIVFTQRSPSEDFDLWLLPLTGNRTPFLYVHAEGDQNQAQISPDGRWLAYVSTETGRNEVYVQSFPQAGKKLQVSTVGGVQPRWRRDRSELFYLQPDSTLVAVPLHGDLEAGAPASLFKTDTPTWGAGSTGWRTTYDISSDGQRVLVLKAPDTATPVSVTLNWPALLRK
jgi:hypothetical protein